MNVSETYERTQSRRMDIESYFNHIYSDTSVEILKYIIIKTGNAAQVEDIVQSVYQSFYARISAKGYGDIRSPRAFLFKLAEKELSRHYKRKAVKKEMETCLEGVEEYVADVGVDFDEIMEAKEKMSAIGDIVSKLPLVSYKAFVLYYYYDMTVSEIARNLGISESNVKDRLWRARNTVRKNIRGDLNENQ